MHKVIFNFKTRSLYDWEYIMFGIAVFLIPFHTGHMALSISLFGSMGSKLSIFPVLIGLCLFLYQCVKKREWYVPKICSTFFCILLVWQIFSLIHGLVIFPNWQEISANQFKKLDFLLSILSSKGIFLDTLVIGHTWWAIKLIFTHILEYVVTYGVVIWGISLFYRNREISFQALRYGILSGAIICSTYSVIEFLYLFGSYDAMAILAHINSWIYDIEISHGWWPPLLGGNRVRSIFAEPAYMALYMTVTIPFLLAQIRIAKTKKWFWKVLFAMQLFMMWGTNSKTAMGILLAEALSAIIFFYLRRKKISLKKSFFPLLIIILLCGTGIGLNWLFQHRYAVDYDLISITSNDTVTLKITNKSPIVWDKRTGIDLTSAWFTKDWEDESGRVNVPLDRTLFPGQSCEVAVRLPEPISKEEYSNVVMELTTNNAFQNDIRLASQGAAKFTLQWNQNRLVDKGEAEPLENKMTAMTSQTEGSNQQRYGMMHVETLIGRAHPFFGVGGQELKQAYFVSYIPNWLMKNREVRLWVTYQKTKGLLKSGFPIISDYTHQFASYGLPGFILFLMPSFYAMFLLFKKKVYWIKAGLQEYMHIAILGISYFGLMVAFIGGNSTQLYIYWLLLGALIGYYGTLECDSKSQ
ncbi:hypothetical protein ACT01_08995 [Megasphaera hexanoica]|nr:hypothetical protein ACT01_08995 [Megasphaera hexanoica]